MPWGLKTGLSRESSAPKQTFAVSQALWAVAFRFIVLLSNAIIIRFITVFLVILHLLKNNLLYITIDKLQSPVGIKKNPTHSVQFCVLI